MPVLCSMHKTRRGYLWVSASSSAVCLLLARCYFLFLFLAASLGLGWAWAGLGWGWEKGEVRGEEGGRRAEAYLLRRWIGLRW